MLNRLRVFGATLLFLALGIAGCAKSRVIKPLRAPTIGGKSSKTFVSSSIRNTITGECDPLSTYFQLSYDLVTWINLTNTCPTTSNFSLMLLANPKVTAYIRGSTGKANSETAKIEITFTQPPNGVSMDFVVSGRIDPYGSFGTQNAIGSSFTGLPMSNSTRSLDIYETDIVYEQKLP